MTLYKLQKNILNFRITRIFNDHRVSDGVFAVVVV